MKTVAILVVVCLLISCSKDTAKLQQATDTDYIGTYVSINPIALDTAHVSTLTGNLISIRWVAKSGNSITFDSVIIAYNQSFTDNEFIENGASSYRSVGSGYFLPRVMKFTFQLGGSAKIIFDGIKQ